MDLEQLNRTQIILLTLLVSFVTSIATGIVTVSLVNQAPQGITQTVNRIVERTVEKVVPDSSASQGASVVTTEKTVIVRDDDLASQSIEKVQKAIVRIVPKGVEDPTTLARGVVVDARGVVVTDKSALEGGLAFEVILATGERLPASVRGGTNSNVIAVIDISLSSTTKLTPVVFADTAQLRLGQSVIRIGGRGRDAVGMGVVAALPEKEGEGRGRFLEASVESSFPGSILMTLFGEVVGLTTADSLNFGPELYSGSASVKAALAPKTE